MRPTTRLAGAAAAIATTAVLAGAVPAGAQQPKPLIRIDLSIGRPTPGPPPPPVIVEAAHGLLPGGQLVVFDLTGPGRRTAPVTITGLPTGSTVVGIDERPKTGALYAVVKQADGTGAMYTVVPSTGVATLAAPLRNATSLAPIVLTGSQFGVDFNPAADALRIVGDDGQNLRALPSDRLVAAVNRFTGDTFVDGTLSYTPVAVSPRPAATGITASAYTQNLPVTAATALFNIDTVAADLTTQAPPNDGTQVKVADVATAGRPVHGFDITTAGTTDRGFVAVGYTEVVPSTSALEDLLRALGLVPTPTRARTELVQVDLTTGAFTTRGAIAGGPIVDFAIDTPAPVAP